MKPETVNLNVGAIVLATGWDLYDTSRLDMLGAGKIQNVVTNMQMERIASPNGLRQERFSGLLTEKR